jgi:hypothetical protein
VAIDTPGGKDKEQSVANNFKAKHIENIIKVKMY